jgi:hypothetical protein
MATYTEDRTKNIFQEQLLQLRLLVGYLGERDQFGWWPTGFFEPSSRSFLEPIFSKSFRQAQYHGVLEAARLQHDHHLSAGTYHLFRLPEELEQDLYLLMQNNGDGELGESIFQNKEAALDALKLVANENSALHEGPMIIGRIDDLALADTLQSIAGAYYAAFLQNTNAYPYLLK